MSDNEIDIRDQYRKVDTLLKKKEKKEPFVIEHNDSTPDNSNNNHQFDFKIILMIMIILYLKSTDDISPRIYISTILLFLFILLKDLLLNIGFNHNKILIINASILLLVGAILIGVNKYIGDDIFSIDRIYLIMK